MALIAASAANSGEPEHAAESAQPHLPVHLPAGFDFVRHHPVLVAPSLGRLSQQDPILYDASVPAPAADSWPRALNSC
jgi:hypothetical protein